MSGEEDFEEEEIPKEEKLGILQYFITNAPPGHQKTVLEAAKKLNLSDVIDDGVLNKIFREFNLSTNVVLPRKDGGNFVLDKAAEVDESTYKSARTGETFTVDHVKGAVTSVKSDSKDSSSARQAVQKAMEEYVSKNYYKDGTGVEVFAEGDDTLRIVYGVEHKKLKVFWSGRWSSHYTVKFTGGTAKLSGDVRMLLHYFEGGNVQQSLEKDFKEMSLSYTDDASLANALVAKISELETQLQRSVSELYQTMEVLAKGMRRMLPMNKIQFDWVNYSKYQVRDQYAGMTVTHSKE